MKRTMATIAMIVLAASAPRAGSGNEVGPPVPRKPRLAAAAGGAPAASDVPGRPDFQLEPIDFRGQRPKAADVEAIVALAAERGAARVVLGLPVRFVPEGLLEAPGVAEQRRGIALARENVLINLTGIEEVVRRFETIPYVVVVLNARGALSLRGLEGLASAQLDRESRVSLASTTPIIGATTAASRGFTGAGQTIAILDTGVDSNHPFLAGSVVDEACFGSCPNGGSTQTGAGSGAPLPAIVAGAFHGTHVAGIAAGHATPNVTFSGTARGAGVMAINVFHRVDNSWPFNNCGADPSPCARLWDSDAIAGLEHVFNRRGAFAIAAVNMSFGGGAFASECSGSWYQAAVSNLRSVGIATVAAAGNDGFAAAIGEPACVPGVISVGATNDGDVVPQFSNSAFFLDFLAPGVSVTSSAPGGGFVTANGTSMAAPHVSGSFALLKQRFPNASVFALERALAQTGLPVLDFGSGITTPRIRVARALASPAVFAHDFTRDRSADIGIWRASTHEWWIPGQPTMIWGDPGDIPVPADYDGNGTTDIAIWRPSTGEWWIAGLQTVVWGVAGDVPVPADYDGNGTIDIAVWRPSSGMWWIRGQATVHWGTPGDVPVPADYDNDGKADIAIFRASTHEWFIRGQATTVVWGDPGDVAVPADYDGNGTSDVAIWRPSTGTWWIPGRAPVQWGQAGDVPIPRDVGFGQAELTVWRPSTGQWFTLMNHPPFVEVIQWGGIGDVPL